MPLCRVPNKGDELGPDDPNIDPLDFPLIFLHLFKGVGCHSQTYFFTVRQCLKIKPFIQNNLTRINEKDCSPSWRIRYNYM
jgi:hypothetical protein